MNLDIGSLDLNDGRSVNRLKRADLWRNIGLSVEIISEIIKVRLFVDGNLRFSENLPSPGSSYFEGKDSPEGYALILGPANAPENSAEIEVWMDEFAYSGIARGLDHFALGTGNLAKGVRKQFLDTQEIETFFRILHLSGSGNFATTGSDYLPKNFPVDDIRIPNEFREFIDDTVPGDKKKAERLERMIKLGRNLFKNDLLSVGSDGIKNVHMKSGKTMTCATCHVAEFAFTDNEELAIGTAVGERNTPTIFNRILSRRQFFDQRAPDLIQQVLKPVTNPLEMNGNLGKIIEALKNDSAYAALKTEFEAVFPGRELNSKLLGIALAGFVVTRIQNVSLADKIIDGSVAGARKKILHGKFVFENKARCIACHNGPNFSDELLHDTGVVVEKSLALKTPSLWNLAATAPFFHDGSIQASGGDVDAALMQIVNFYSETFVQRRSAQRLLDTELRPLALNKDEKEALVEYLKALRPVSSP